jgi:hypothetical protein
MKSVKIYILLLFILISCNQTTKEQPEYEYVKADTTVLSGKQNKAAYLLGYNTYSNDEFNFKLNYPRNWKISENKSDSITPIINLYQERNQSLEFPLSIHTMAEVSHLSFYPKGLGTEFPMGTTLPLNRFIYELPVFFTLNKEESVLFLLATSQVYGYFLKPANPPPGWSEDGFIFAQIAVDGFSLACFDHETGAEKSPQECDPLMGDRLDKYGELRESAKNELFKILSSLAFFSEGDQYTATENLIEIEEPTTGTEIFSPVTIKGEARGKWYFEGDFPVKVLNYDYQTIATGIAKAEGAWMTEDFVPFEVIINYKRPYLEDGYILLSRSNASGLPEHDQWVIIPVNFGQQVQ